ncbi:hypothetical protein HDU92_007695 [Lobulomyces angularis]|nr:hypothetical protein HDU92_007695 [Lobulomyces angularis]
MGILKNYSFQLKILEERHLNMQEEYKNLKVSNDLKFRKKFFGESKLENFKKSDDLNLEQEKSYEIYNQIFNNFLRYQVNEISLDIENLEKVESNIKLKFDQLKAEVDFIVDDLNNLSLSYNKKLDKKT